MAYSALEYLQNKVYVARNVEGEPNLHAMSSIRKIEKKLKSIPQFISLLPEGSMFKGYSVNKSDLDLTILFDSGGIKPTSREYVEMRNSIFSVAQEAKLELWEEMDSLGLFKTNFDFVCIDINTESLETNILRKSFKEVSSIFKMCSGLEISSYRKFWFSKILSLPDQEIDSFISTLVETLADGDFDPNTVCARLQLDLDTFKKTRKRLWDERVRSFLST